ncbi:hypothetical protein G7A66_07725 [Altererythrobacter sp. SALINAS58]|nr:hypothetical protein [Alteripontixanthobacter muriae]NTZ42977.1 hypothetical protein [Alteripontixanthobacter muriae]
MPLPIQRPRNSIGLLLRLYFASFFDIALEGNWCCTLLRIGLQPFGFLKG